MNTNGFVKGAIFGMLVSGAVATAMMPKKKSMMSGVEKKLKVVGTLADSVADIFH